MKFVVCNKCMDWVKLCRKERTCVCGKSGGKYLKDDLNAVIWGPSFAVGVDNHQFTRAAKSRMDVLRRFYLRGEWWIIQAGVLGSHVEHFKTRKAAMKRAEEKR